MQNKTPAGKNLHKLLKKSCKPANKKRVRILWLKDYTNCRL